MHNLCYSPAILKTYIWVFGWFCWFQLSWFCPNSWTIWLLICAITLTPLDFLRIQFLFSKGHVTKYFNYNCPWTPKTDDHIVMTITQCICNHVKGVQRVVPLYMYISCLNDYVIQTKSKKLFIEWGRGARLGTVTNSESLFLRLVY